MSQLRRNEPHQKAQTLSVERVEPEGYEIVKKGTLLNMD